MTDPVTPAAAPAAPAATATDPAAPAAPAASAAPAAPAASEPTSLIPADPGQPAPAPAAAPAKPADPNAPQPKAPAEWFLAPGVKGEGEAPKFFLADKYKTMQDQAEAYPHLAKKLGAFTGAPADGKYEFKLPEGIDGEFDQEHPMYKELVKECAEMQISNDGFNRLLGKFAQYEASLVPDPAANIADAKKALGETADARITSAAQWVQANLGPELFKKFRNATDAAKFPGDQIAQVVEIVEAAIGKTRVQMPKPGQDVPAALQNEEQELELLKSKRDAKGGILYFSDPVHRAKVDALRVRIQQQKGAA